MVFIIQFIFWASFFLLFYTYIGYFLILKTLVWIKSKLKKTSIDETKENKNFVFSFVSIIIAAYNEEKVIARRIENLLRQDYPRDKMEIIVASDGSTDKTVEIARQYEKYGIKVLDFKQNRGKAAVHNDAAKEAKGEILIFTDAETEFERNFVKKIVEVYSDSKFGVGAGELIFRSPETFGETEGIYWEIEKKLRYYEYLLGILPFASGACFSIRKKLYEEIPLHSDIDNILPLRAIQKGYKVFYCKDAIAYEYTVSNPKQLFRKRYRTALRSMTDILSELSNLIKKKKWGVIFVLFSHRFLRWWGSLLVPVLFFINLKLFNYGLLYQIVFTCQILFYIFALLGFLQKISSIAYSFILANIAFIFAIFSYFKGKKIASWKN